VKRSATSVLILCFASVDRIVLVLVVADFQDPHSIAVLLQNDLVVVDLTSQG